MSEDIKKTINELHIYEKKVLKELEANPNATPEEIAENADMDIKAVMSAAGSLASKDIIVVEKDVEEEISLSDAGRAYASNGLPERKILDVLVEKRSIHMKDLADASGLDKKEAKNFHIAKVLCIHSSVETPRPRTDHKTLINSPRLLLFYMVWVACSYRTFSLYTYVHICVCY